MPVILESHLSSWGDGFHPLHPPPTSAPVWSLSQRFFSEYTGFPPSWKTNTFKLNSIYILKWYFSGRCLYSDFMVGGRTSSLGSSPGWNHRPLQKRERTGKEYGCFPFVWKTKILKWKINYILESLPRIEAFGGGKWQKGSSTNIAQNREFVWIG